MTRKKFIILLLLPFLIIIPSLLQIEMHVSSQIAIFVLACLFIWAVQLLRLRYLGYTWRQCIKGFVVGAFGNVWWKMWEKDPQHQRHQS